MPANGRWDLIRRLKFKSLLAEKGKCKFHPKTGHEDPEGE